MLTLTQQRHRQAGCLPDEMIESSGFYRKSMNYFFTNILYLHQLHHLPCLCSHKSQRSLKVIDPAFALLNTCEMKERRRS